MRPIFTILLFIFSVTITMAQITGGGVNEEKKPEPTPEPVPQEVVETPKKADRYKINFITIGAFMPKLELKDPEVNYGIFNLSDGGKTGFFIDFGGINFFVPDFGPDQTMNVGLYKSLIFSVAGYNWYSADPETVKNATKSPFFFGEFKLGPSFTYHLSNDIGFDVYWKFGIVLSYGASIEYGSAYTEEYIKYSHSTVAVGFGTGIGFNARLYNLLINIGYDFGTLKYKYDASIDSDTYEIEPKFNTDYFKVGIGYVIKNTR